MINIKLETYLSIKLPSKGQRIFICWEVTRKIKTSVGVSVTSLCLLNQDRVANGEALRRTGTICGTICGTLCGCFI